MSVSLLRRFAGAVLLFPLLAGMAFPAFALDPEPRLWNHLPLGTNFAGIAYAYSDIDIFLDPALRLEDVSLELDTWGGKYVRTFELLGKSSRIDITQAYQEGRWKGLLDGAPAATSRHGLSDTFVRVAMNLYGAPPLGGREFVAYRARQEVETIVGVGLAVRLPTGQYNKRRLLNLGQNRYVFRPQLGVTHSRGPWSTEATAQVAFYTENDEFFDGNRLEQKPLFIVHGHLVRTFRPGFWASVSLGYDNGGEKKINGVEKNDRQQDIGWKLSLAYPINRASGVKLFYIGTRTEEDTGFDSDTVGGSLSLAW